MNILIIGAGAWGTALAQHASACMAGVHQVTLWARSAEQVARMRASHTNEQYLPGVALAPSLALSCQPLASLASQADLVVIGTPMAGLRPTLTQLGSVSAPVVWLCKGFENTTGYLGHEVFQSVVGTSGAIPPWGVLSGPSFAQEVANGQPTALVAASHLPGVSETLVKAFHGGALRVYVNADPVGVEVGGAVKNVMAIATGLCDGLDLGLNARAALITRGLAEITRLGLALGGQSETLMGLGGLGDLVLTATGSLSRNRQVGLLLAQGHSLAQAVDSLGHVAEGVACARTVVQRAAHLGVDMPIARCVVAVLDGDLSPQQAVAKLMGRDPTAES